MLKQWRIAFVLLLIALVGSACIPVHGMAVTNQIHRALVVELVLVRPDTTTFLAFRLPPKERVLMDRIGVKDVRSGQVSVFDFDCTLIGTIDWPGHDDFGIAVGAGSIGVGDFPAGFGDGPYYASAQVIDPPPCPMSTSPP